MSFSDASGQCEGVGEFGLPCIRAGSLALHCAWKTKWAYGGIFVQKWRHEAIICTSVIPMANVDSIWLLEERWTGYLFPQYNHFPTIILGYYVTDASKSFISGVTLVNCLLAAHEVGVIAKLL